jgi:hypothetical protein
MSCIGVPSVTCVSSFLHLEFPNKGLVSLVICQLATALFQSGLSLFFLFPNIYIIGVSVILCLLCHLSCNKLRNLGVGVRYV